MTRRLLTLNGLATVCVVLYHATGWGFVAMFWWTHRYLPVVTPNFDQMSSASYFALRGIEQLVSFAIPAFLFVSGFFAAMAASREKRREVWRSVGNRILHLVIPYLLWSLVMMAVEVAQGVSYSPDQVVRILLTGQASPAFYFVPLLCQLYVLSPLLIRVVQAHPWRLMLLAATCQLAERALQYGQVLGWNLPDTALIRLATSGWFLAGNIAWFCLGMVASRHPQALTSIAGRWRTAWAAGLLVLIPLGMLEWEWLLRASGESWLDPHETVLDNLFALTFLMTFLAYAGARLPIDRRLSELGTKSFGVYLAHSLALIVLAKGVYHLAPQVLGRPLLFQALLIAGGLGIPLLSMAAVRRSPLRKMYGVLFG